MGKVNKLGFPVWTELVTQYDVTGNEGMFNGSVFELLVFPDGYSPVEDEIGESGIIPGIASSVVAVPAVIRGFDVKPADTRDDVFKILDAIRLRAETLNAGRYTPMTVYDYHFLDDPTAVSVGYTVRSMAMFSLKRLSGSIRGNTSFTSIRRVEGGISFRLMAV